MTADLPRMHEEVTKNRLSSMKQFELMRALIIDGDRITAGYTARAFGRLGISCEIAENVRLALQMIRDAGDRGAGYDLCLLSCNMDQEQISSAVSQIRECDRADRITVACLSRRGSSLRGAVQDSGGDIYMERPLLQSKLYRMMKDISRKK